MTANETEIDYFTLFAIVGPGSHTNERYSFTLGGWTVDDRSLHMIFFRRVPLAFEDTDIYGAVQDLENILLALFVNDRLPRKIFYFEYPNHLDKETRLRLLFMLGQPKDWLTCKQAIVMESSDSCGFIFNRRIDQDWIPSDTTVKEWFNFFCENESLAGSAVLLQRSFWTINGLYCKYRYYDYLHLCEALVLMVSALEYLFLRGRPEKITSQFKCVGSAYYDERVSEDYFRDFGPDAKKLTRQQVSKILGELYNIRSAIAHGHVKSLFSGKKKSRGRSWSEINKWLKVQKKDPQDKSMFFSHILLAMGHFQKHIFAILSVLKDHPIAELPTCDGLSGGGSDDRCHE